MTAVIGILNKRAVAIAADSASTSSTGKIFNKANKIFALSQKHPIGITIYNNDSFMETPWDVIIKMYRTKLKANTFDTLEEYKNDFINFLHTENFFCDNAHQVLELNRFFYGIAASVSNSILEIVGNSDPANYLNELKLQLKDRIEYFTFNKTVLPEFIGFSKADFEAFIAPSIQEVFQAVFIKEKITIDVESEILLKEAFYRQLIVKESSTLIYTGIVFSGFGEKEIFPSLISLKIYLAFNNKLRYFVESELEVKIDHNRPSDIRTFAQADVMLTILKGIEPSLQQTYNLNFKKLLDEYDKLIINTYSNSDKGDLEFTLNKVNKNIISDVIVQNMNQVIQEKYIDPLYQAVAGFSIEDLSEMAESLIYLTYLQRKITNAAESVGGPVDVAILSKAEGFVWVKRKQHFKPELNSHFV